jgi:hypothetical protein
MRADELYQQLKSYAIAHTRSFGKSHYVISQDVFFEYQHLFVKRRNLFNKRDDYRTTDLLKHVHAIHEGDFVEFHMDYGNVFESTLSGIPHLFIDAIPYFTYYVITRHGFSQRIRYFQQKVSHDHRFDRAKTNLAQRSSSQAGHTSTR